MKAQVEAAAQFLIQLISQNQPRNIADDRLQQFKMNLINLLEQSFQVTCPRLNQFFAH